MSNMFNLVKKASEQSRNCFLKKNYEEIIVAFAFFHSDSIDAFNFHANFACFSVTKVAYHAFRHINIFL